MLINLFRADRLPWVYRTREERMDAAVAGLAGGTALHEPSVEVPVVALEEMRRLVSEGSVAVVDARPKAFHRLGHIAGALSVPRADFRQAYLVHRQRLQQASAGIVVYCASEECREAALVAQALIKLGHPRVAIFAGGWQAWTETERRKAAP